MWEAKVRVKAKAKVTTKANANTKASAKGKFEDESKYEGYSKGCSEGYSSNDSIMQVKPKAWREYRRQKLQHSLHQKEKGRKNKIGSKNKKKQM
jgi:hypothetical protein